MMLEQEGLMKNVNSKTLGKRKKFFFLRLASVGELEEEKSLD